MCGWGLEVGLGSWGRVRVGWVGLGCEQDGCTKGKG